METNPSAYNLAKIQNNLENRNLYLDSYPVQVHFLMIDTCNVKCIMCGGDYFRSKSGRMITLEKFKTMATNLRFESVRAIVLAGAGDPLLNADLVQIIQFVKKEHPHITLSVTTNGLALTEKLSGLLVENGVNLVNISINSATRASYRRIMQVDGLDRVCRNARAFIELRNRSGKPIPLQFSAAINRLNIEDLPRLVQIGKEIGINSINLFYTRFYPERIRHLNVDDPADRLENEASLFFHQGLSDEMVVTAKILAQRYGISFTHEPLFRENAPPSPCTWPMTQLMVGFDGEIYPCGGSEIHFKEKVEKGIYNFGNALQGPVDAFWNNEIYRGLRISSQQGETCLIPECRCCANTISPNDVRSHIMQWDLGEPESVPKLGNGPRPLTPEAAGKTTPLVSVIVPTYNRPNQLVIALKSVLGQTYKNLELIVVNDAGTDVENVVSSLRESQPITYIKHGKNRGLAAARNSGIKLARGKYIAYLDDDDLFYPRHVETLVAFLESGEYKVAYTDAYRAHQEKKNGEYVVIKRDVPYSFDFDYDRILETNFVPVLCFMHERSCAEEAGLFDESLKKLEDWDLWIRMSRKFKFAHIKQLTCEFTWRTDGTTMTSGPGHEFIEARNMISRKYNGAHPVSLPRPKFPGKVEKSLVSIVILTFNQLKYTRECVGSIRKHTPEPHEIIFVDNGSTDGTVKWLNKLVKEHRHYKLIRNEKNLGFAKGCNQGIESASGEYVLLLNNDVVVTKDWLSGMLETLSSAPDIGIVGPMTDNISGRQRIPFEERPPLTSVDAYAADFRSTNRNRRVPVPGVIGFCMLFRRALAEQIGSLDERFGVGCFEDDDFCLRARLAGYRNVIAGDVFIHHYGSRGFVGNRIDADAAFRANYKIFLEKWRLEARMAVGKKLAAIPKMEKAADLFGRGYVQKATQLLIAGIQYAPQEGEIYRQLAEMLIEAGLFQDALGVINAMPSQARGELRSIELSGYCKEGLNLLSEAGEHANQALVLNPRSAPALNLKGVLAYAQGDRSPAIDFFTKAVAADPSYGEAYTNLGIVKWAAGEQEDGFQLLMRGFILSPGVPTCAVHFHKAATALGWIAKAARAFRAAQCLHPTHKRITFLLTDLFIQQERFADALQEIEKAILYFGVDEEFLPAALEVRNKIGPLTIKAKSGPNASVSLCMVVKNGEKGLAKCLASVKPVIQEMIVVDTGSTDRTRDIARVFGAQVYDFAWTDDFSAARNYSISKATGDWIFVLDADEVISPADHARFKNLIAGAEVGPAAYAFTTRSYVDLADLVGTEPNDHRYPEQAGSGWIPSKRVRLFTRHDKISFENPVHESIEPSLERLRVEIRGCPVPIHHYGKLGREENKIAGDRGLEHDSKETEEGGGDGSMAPGARALDLSASRPTAAGPGNKGTVGDLVSLVILTCNELRYTKECVESIRRHTPEPHEILFVDNGSKDGTISWLRALVKENPKYKLIENEINLGFARGCNQGLKAASGEYLLLLNNDVVVTEGWLSGLQECLESSPKIGITGPMTNHISGIQKIEEVGYRSLEGLDEYARGFREKNRHRRIPCRRLVGFCMLFRRELVVQVGLLDENFGTGNFEDDDFCLRAELAGFRNFIAGDVFIHHYGSRSFIGNKIDYRKTMKGNHNHFLEKWNGLDPRSAEGKKYLSLRGRESAKLDYEKDQSKKAVDRLLAVIRLGIEAKESYVALAEILLDAKQYDQAFSLLNQVPDGDPDGRKYALLGYCQEGLANPLEAQKLAEQALSLDPSDAFALNLKGILSYRKGDKEEAQNYFQMATAADRGFGEPHTNLGVIRWEENRKKEALYLFERGFILSPTITDILQMYHAVITEEGEFARAEQNFREAQALHPFHKRIRFFLIDILLKQGKNEEAMEQVEQSMSHFGIEDEMLRAALEVRKKIGPQEKSRQGQGGRISLCMIVKDEENDLLKCLRSVKPVVDEMIVVDTGSADRTKDIATALGAKVFEFSWENDFSAARNFSISQAKGGWILALDADEVISPLDHASLLALTKEGTRKAGYSLVTRNYLNTLGVTQWTANDGTYDEEAGSGWIPSEKVRLFPRDRRIHFENPVHEFVEPSMERNRIPIKKGSIPVHHYGKLNEKKEKGKGEEYFLLGKKKLEKSNADIRSLRELAVQANFLQRYEEAAELWHQVIRLQPKLPEPYINLASIYMNLGKFQEASAHSKKAIELDPDGKEAVLNYSIVEFTLGNIKNVISALESLLSKIPEYPLAMGLLSVAYRLDGEREKSQSLIAQIKTAGFNYNEYLQNTAKNLIALGRSAEAGLLLEMTGGKEPQERFPAVSVP
jgi:GT2 family glycosyltransferase/MoaA/NifB/PqqE/SkfB family radical SAM enzyme/Flp pilus assembly protein TadD